MERSFEHGEQKVIAIHQPNYLPWLGFFYKIWASDVFVFLDDVEHSKKYPTRRTRIRVREHPGTSNWLTVPLSKSSDFSLIKDLQIDNSQPWQKFHLHKIKEVYRLSPFFGTYFPILEVLLLESPSFSLLSDLNIHFVIRLLELLDIKRTLLRSSELPVNGKGSTYNLALVKQLSGTAYLSGMGGRNYMDIDEFVARGIEMKFSAFGSWLWENPYPQYQGKKPLGGLSIVDALFNVGSEGVLEMFEKSLNRGVQKK